MRFFGYIDIAISNFTDIDDKIIKRANEESIVKEWHKIPERYIKYHLENIRKVNNLPFYVNPLVTTHIEDIKKFIDILIEKGYAYRTKSGIYFDVDKYPYYGQLSGLYDKKSWEQELEFLQDKKNPYDFALWKARKENEPYWDYKDIPGRPGWHIECSAMSTRYLGFQFDIHSGGSDLIFPHHENEIAQSEAALGVRPWVKYWIHYGLVKIKGEKMSKSLGNIITIDEFLKKYGEKETRYILGSIHYRDPIDLNEEFINQSILNFNYISSTIKLIVGKIKNMDRTFYMNDDEIKIFYKVVDYNKMFINSLKDDFDMTKATSILLEATRFINKEVIDKERFALWYASYTLYENANRIYGLWDDIFYEKRERNLEIDLINLIIDIRKELRKRKIYDLSDSIRESLRKLNIELMDRGEETLYRFL